MVNNKIAQRAVAAGLSGLMAFGAAAPAALATGIDWKGFEFVKSSSNDDGDYWKRIGGKDRYETMKKIVEAYNEIGEATRATILGDLVRRDASWNYHSTAVLASGDNFPDALAANGLAGYMTNEGLNNGALANTTNAVPVILTKAGSLSSEAKDLLKNMQVQNVIIMGGTAAVSQDVEDAINKMGIGTQRVAGADRQETSVKALQRINGNWEGRKGTYDLIIATGANYADALSISPYAYRMGVPVVLTKADGTLTDEAVEVIKSNDKIREIVIVGGTSAVSDAVMGQIGTLRDNGQSVVYHRIAGVDRYETSAKIAEFEVATWWDYIWSNPGRNDFYKGSIWDALGVDNDFSFNRAVVATGEKFPDALAGGQLAGGWGTDVEDFDVWMPAPLLLTKDGNTEAERVIASQLGKNQIAVGTDYYASWWDWEDHLRDLYPVGSAEYASLVGQWYDFYTTASRPKVQAFAEYPFYIAYKGIPSEGVAVPQKATYTITYEIIEVPGAQVPGAEAPKNNIRLVNLKSDDPEISNISVDDNEDLAFTYIDSDLNSKTQYFNLGTKTYKPDLGTNNEITNIVVSGDEWYSVGKHTITITQEWTDTDNPIISDFDIIRYVGHVDDFYGIVLGGKDAVSGDKMDKLDDVVENVASTWNSSLDDTFWRESKNWGINLQYSRLIYRADLSDATTDVFQIVGTGDYVDYDLLTETWSLEV